MAGVERVAQQRINAAARQNASRLDLSGLDLTTLPDSIGNLTSLTTLSLGRNGLTALPDSIGNLTSLTTLDLGRNGLTALPDSIGNLTSLTRLELGGNPLVFPPAEVVALGSAGVLGFLRAVAEGGVDQWGSKMLVVGEAAVGKTSVTKALCGLPNDPAEPQTHGVHVDPLLLDHPGREGVRMRLSVWDFGGQLEYRATQRFYLSDRSLFVLVWNSRRGWRTGGQVEEWLQAITARAPGSPILVVATHAAQSVVDLDEQDLRHRYPRIAGFARVDCADGTGIDALRDQVTTVAAALPLMGQRWPANWAAAARALSVEPGRHISLSRCEELMEAVGDAIVRGLVRAALHDRGEILHFPYDPELAETVILEPAWVDAMITRVLDSQQVFDRGGVLSREHRAQLWHDLDDAGLRELLTALMERFDLAYRTDAPDHTDVALVVERLPAGRPAFPPQWEQARSGPDASEVKIRYKLGSRQAGIPSWFIAREHRFTTGTAWARGVLLTYRGQPDPAWALLEDDDTAQPTYTLTVRGRGPYKFYSVLDEGFTRIISDRYPGLPMRRLIPCPCTPPPQPGCTHEFDDDDAARALDRGAALQCPKTLTMVDARTLLLGLRPAPLDTILTRLTYKVDHVHDDVTDLQDGVTGLQAATARIEQSQLQTLDTIRDLLGHRAAQGVHCPSIFTLTKTRPLRYELQLYCEQPDNPHPLADGDGTYRIRRLPPWLHTYAPYLRMLLLGLRYTLPIVGPALTGTGITLTETDKNRLEASCKLLEALTATPPSSRHDTPQSLNPTHPGQPQRAATADFAQLRQALLAIDPDLGGLRPRQLPENGGIAYLCAHHRQALTYPQQP